MVSLHAALLAAALSGAGQTVLLDFYADWCAPCRAMNPTVEALRTAGYPVEQVNIDKNRALAAKFGIQRIPCFVMIVDGREVDRVTEGTTYSRLERMCKLAATGSASALSATGSASAQTRPAELPTPIPPSDNRIIPASFSQPPALGATGSASATSTQATGVSDATMLAASVRLRVEDRDGHSCGSGTIIDSRDGEALVLTCGHLFRDSQGKGQITVDLFNSGTPETVAGRLISYDLDRDVGLVAIRTPRPVVAARLAPPGYRLGVGQAVASVGCNNGEPPTVRHSQVTRLNVQNSVVVAGQPIEGRSGGGLFSAEGYVVGICYAADPRDQEGFFAALTSIHSELDRDKLAFIYQSPSGTNATEPIASNTATPPLEPPPPMPARALESGGGNPALAASTGLSSNEQAAMDELRRRWKDGAEIVCIVRPRSNPEARSEVIVLDRASAEFLNQLKKLAAENRQSDRPHPTSLEVPKDPPKPRRVLLEWSATK